MAKQRTPKLSAEKPLAQAFSALSPRDRLECLMLDDPQIAAACLETALKRRSEETFARRFAVLAARGREPSTAQVQEGGRVFAALDKLSDLGLDIAIATSETPAKRVDKVPRRARRPG